MQKVLQLMSEITPVFCRLRVSINALYEINAGSGDSSIRIRERCLCCWWSCSDGYDRWQHAIQSVCIQMDCCSTADDRKGKVFQLGSSSDATIGKSFSNEGVLIKRLFICSVRLDFIWTLGCESTVIKFQQIKEPKKYRIDWQNRDILLTAPLHESSVKRMEDSSHHLLHKCPLFFSR